MFVLVCVQEINSWLGSWSWITQARGLFGGQAECIYTNIHLSIVVCVYSVIEILGG